MSRAEVPRSRWPLVTQRWLPLVPALLLCAVALHQLYLARVDAFTPWKGGGFGMFSTTDTGPHRRLRAYLIGAAGEYDATRALADSVDVRQVAIPASLDDLAMRVRALPDERRLREFARRIGTEVGGSIAALSAVRVEVWRTDFDAEDLTPRETVVRALTLPWEADGT